MTFRAIYLEVLWQDLREAAHWYDKREPGLGAGVAQEFSHTVDRVMEAPLRYRTVHGQVRCLRTHRFPYSVLYLVEDDTVIFVGLKHGAQGMRRFMKGRLPDE